jgi:hypothetical protein
VVQLGNRDGRVGTAGELLTRSARTGYWAEYMMAGQIIVLRCRRQCWDESVARRFRSMVHSLRLGSVRAGESVEEERETNV